MDANKRILELMAQRNWSAYRLVKETNLSHSLIYNMVRRNNLPTIDTLTRISAAFGLSLQQFFTEDDDPAAPVSYTHLDVYKRQPDGLCCSCCNYRRIQE